MSMTKAERERLERLEKLEQDVLNGRILHYDGLVDSITILRREKIETNEIIARIWSDINETKFSTGVSDERIKVRMSYTLAHRLMTHRDTAFSPQLNSPYPTIFGYEVEPYNAPDNEVSYKIMVEWFYKLIEKGKYDNGTDD